METSETAPNLDAATLNSMRFAEGLEGKLLKAAGNTLGYAAGASPFVAAALALSGNPNEATEILKFTANVLAHGVIATAVPLAITHTLWPPEK